MSIAEKLAKERRARLAAERLLEQKKRELSAANAQLSRHARLLSDQIVEQRQGLEQALHQAESLKGQNNKVRSDLVRANHEAEIARRRLWEAVDTIEDGFAVFDAERHLVMANRAYLSVFRNRHEIQPGTHYDTLLVMLTKGGSIDLEGEDPDSWRRRMSERLTRAVIDPLVIRLVDGRHIRILDRRGEAGDYVSMALDITETIQREADLEEARASAEAANRAKSAFLANMSHEIRTPMNGVVGMAELLCESDLGEEQKIFAETIKSSGEALLTIINDVLDYSKIEAKKLRLYPETFDLERCVHEVLLLLQPLAREKGLKLLVDYDLFLPTRYVADPGRMRQILMNLVGNAVKFTETGHVLIRVVGLELPDHRFELHITVEDTGIGIAPESAEHIFGEFNQVEDQSNRKFEGTGLGLSITRELVEMMGGKMWLDSELGEGSCFGFRVAFAAGEPVQVVDKPDRPILLRHALIVDDVHINRVILERQLETYGLDVKMCRSPAEALQAVESDSAFDIILTDHDMPDLDGPALAAALRSAGVTAPIVLLSSQPQVSGEVRAQMAAVLEKPILRNELFRTLQDLSYPAAPARLGQAGTSAPEPASPSGRKMRVLAAEDNRTNQLVFAKMVADFDIDLKFALNGRDAVEIWKEFRPDLIFMDISMPEMDGREAARSIRACEAERGLPPVPIVALTAHAMDGDSVSILEAGIDYYLTKPLRKVEIATKINEFCPAEASSAAFPAEPAE